MPKAGSLECSCSPSFCLPCTIRFKTFMSDVSKCNSVVCFFNPLIALEPKESYCKKGISIYDFKIIHLGACLACLDWILIGLYLKTLLLLDSYFCPSICLEDLASNHNMQRTLLRKLLKRDSGIHLHRPLNIRFIC